MEIVHFAKKENDKIHRAEIDKISVFFPKEIGDLFFSIKETILYFLLIFNSKKSALRHVEFAKKNIEVHFCYSLRNLKKEIQEYVIT